MYIINEKRREEEEEFYIPKAQRQQVQEKQNSLFSVGTRALFFGHAESNAKLFYISVAGGASARDVDGDPLFSNVEDKSHPRLWRHKPD